MSNQDWPLRWDLLQRYRLIEVIALWEGRLTTNHLCHTFGIGRQQASRDINEYNRSVAPGNLEYDTHLKGYKPSPGFTPQVTTGVADEYLHLLNRNRDLNLRFESLGLQAANTEVLAVPLRRVRPEILRPLVVAARPGKRIVLLDVVKHVFKRPSFLDALAISNWQGGWLELAGGRGETLMLAAQ